MSQYSKVAVVHDDFIQFGGAEKVAEALLEIFPAADLFTSIVSNKWSDNFKRKYPNLKLRTSFLDRLPFKEKAYKLFAPFYPLAFYLFNLNGYDLVVSSSSRFAHGVKTDKDTFHLAYIHSPARMVWEPQNYFSFFQLILGLPLIFLLRIWDKHASSFPNQIIANSKTTQKRIKNYWNRDSEVINPFHEMEVKVGKPVNSKKEFYIIVSRLEKWKKIDIAIKACQELGKNLVIVGEGKHKKFLQKLADPLYVKFTGRLSDADLVNKYLNSKALILTQKEDFGITSVEAQALGTPVIAFKEGGATESLIENKTGIFFDSQTHESLKRALVKFEKIEFDPLECIIQAGKFTKDRFKRRILDKLNNE